ncbi:MAG TPA: pilus assembly protein TadG-related protein [Herpetosiphonaceae bacterium]
MKKSRRKPQGQALVTMAIFAVTLFIFVGLGIDSGMLYVERRHLQNVADAACLAATTELSLGGSSDEARVAANQYIISNMDENAEAAFDLPETIDFLSTTVGSGVSLTSGIQVSGSDVRVAVTFPAFTYFMRLAGIETYNVMARARCDATSGGGIWPVAVVRFPGYDEDNERVGVANTGITLPQTYGNGPKAKYLKVRDILQAGDGVLNQDGIIGGSGCSVHRNWFDWPTLGDPASKTGSYHQPCEAASVANPGYEIEMAGLNANPNVGNTSYSGPLLLDARQISFPNRLFYNGQSAATSTNTWKETIIKYILTQYPGPDVIPGQQLGVVNGINTGNILDAIDDRYNGGEIVTTLVYNGQLYQDPDFLVSVVCKPGSFRCNEAPYSNQFVYRNAPPTDPADLFNATCTSYNGKEYFIADGNDLAFLLSNPKPVPAEYLVTLKPSSAQTAAATTVRLTARLSGENIGSENGTGAPEDFAHMKVRWEWTDAAGGTHAVPSANGWQDGMTPVEVDMPVAGTTVTLKVIQSDKETIDCFTALDPFKQNPIPMIVPKRVAGAHTIQVIGRSVGGAATSREHSDYGVLGMRRYQASPYFDTNDFYFSFIGDPSGLVKNVNPQTTIEPKLQLVNANSGNPMSWNVISGSSLTYYQNDARLSGAPAGISAQRDHSGQSPTLRIQVNPATVQPGEYDIDYQVTAGSTHSTRFHLRVEEDLNASIDSWVVALCYANFRITTNLNQQSTPNVIKGRAVSGCLDPNQITSGLTSRLVQWN